MSSREFKGQLPRSWSKKQVETRQDNGVNVLLVLGVRMYAVGSIRANISSPISLSIFLRINGNMVNVANDETRRLGLLNSTKCVSEV
jgi:hypothetical protein